MAVISTANHPKALWPGVKKWFGSQYSDHPLECMEVFPTISSDKAYEEYVQSKNFGLAREKAQGAAYTVDSDRQGYTYRLVNTAYALGYAITKEELADNQYEDVAFNRAAKLARAMRITKEEIAADVFNNGFDSNFPLGDGVEFFSTAHATESGNQANEITGADLSEASLEDLLILVEQARDDRNNRIALRGQKLLVPVQEMFNAERILESTLQNDTANNAVNALRSKGLLPQGYMPWHYLDDSDAFFITTDLPEGTGLIYQERAGVEMDEDMDFKTKNVLHSAYERYAFGAADWRCAFGSAGAG